MSRRQTSPTPSTRPPTVDELRQQLHRQLDSIIAACLSEPAPASFLEFEKTLWELLRSLGCLLIQLFLRARHDRLNLTPWTKTRGYRLADSEAQRTLKTSCGPVTYHRAFLVPRRGGGPGVHPLDIELGLTRDAYSPLVIGWFCRLATRVSFRLARSLGAKFLRGRPAGLGHRGVGLGLGPARLRLPQHRPVARG